LLALSPEYDPGHSDLHPAFTFISSVRPSLGAQQALSPASTQNSPIPSVSLIDFLMFSKNFRVKSNENHQYCALASVGASGDD